MTDLLCRLFVELCLMFEAIGLCVRSILGLILLALVPTLSVACNYGVAKTNQLSYSREYTTKDIRCQLPEIENATHRAEAYFPPSKRHSAHSKQAVCSMMTSVTFLSFCSLAAGQQGSGTHASPSATVNDIDQEVTRRHGFNPILLTLSLLLLFGGFFWSVRILTRAADRETFKQRDWLWLMAFTAAIAWWFVSAFAEHSPAAAAERDDDDGRLLAISFWIFFITMYASKSYRLVRQGHQLILASLVGSILTTVLLAAYCEHVSDDRRLRGRGMQGFAVQALAVEPFSLTIWVRVVTTALQNIVSRPDTDSVAVA